jgi:hypothetical protein
MTPAGWRRPVAVSAGTSEGVTSPVTAVVCAAAPPSIPAASLQWNMPKPNVASRWGPSPVTVMSAPLRRARARHGR